MRRRNFIALLGGAAAWPIAARAQRPGKVWRIGFPVVVPREDFSRIYAGFHQGMQDLGYVEGKDFVVEWRSAEGRYERLPEVAAELVRLNVDIIVTALTAAIRPLQQATSTIPIVMAYSVDPVGNGFVASLARPGGNITGLTGSTDDTAPKQLELLAAVVSSPSRIALLGNPDSPTYPPVRKSALEAAKKAGLLLVTVEARNPQETENAFAAFVTHRVQAVMVASDAIFLLQRQRIAELALANRLPNIFPQRDYVQAGGLMSYGENFFDFYRRAASFVDKIIKGAKPGDLPIEQPTKLHLVINRKNAATLDVPISPKLYIFADEVIE